MNNMTDSNVKDHHVRQELCINRKAYREGRQLKAVKVYTVAQESRFLLVQRVPSVGATEELIKLFAMYGTIEEYRLLDEYPAEEFTEVYWIKYQRIQAARFAKRKMDDYNFFGGSLHVCYAPEYESVEDTRQKLMARRKEVAGRIRTLESELSGPSTQSHPHTGAASTEDERPKSRTTNKGSTGKEDQNSFRKREFGDHLGLDEVASLQGPRLPEEIETKRRNFQSFETGDSSYDSTVHAVRTAVSAFSTSMVPRQLKKSRKS